MTKQFLLFSCVVFFLLFSCNKKGENNNDVSENIEETIEYHETQPNISVPNYNNGNGTIIETKSGLYVEWVYRKHTQTVQIGDFSIAANLTIYSSPSFGIGTQGMGPILGRLKLGDVINITQVAESIISNKHYYWVNINTEDNINGWIFVREGRQPYFENRWEILETINIREKTWTVRKLLPQTVSVRPVLNIRDNPGLVDTNVISQISSYDYDVEIFAATEEMETIDGITDRWLKTNYNGTEGWIFGGYASVDRGGPTYYTPETIISFDLI